MPLLSNETKKLKSRLLTLGATAEENVHQAVEAVLKRDAATAARIVASDREIDLLEVDIEEDCLKILALHQPVAIDLRSIVAILKMNNDLERIGDLAVNIAQRAEKLARLDPIDLDDFDLRGLASGAQTMLRESLDTLVNMDATKARHVCEMDDVVDAHNRRNHRLVRERIEARPAQLDALLQVLLVSRFLERIADLATNIAEDVIYTVEGTIVRHQGGLTGGGRDVESGAAGPRS